MHSVIVPSQKQQAHEQMMQENPRQSDRQATAAECEVIRQQRAIEEQIHISLITQALQNQTEEHRAFAAERRHTIESAQARLAQATQMPFLQIAAAAGEQPVGPDLADLDLTKSIPCRARVTLASDESGPT